MGYTQEYDIESLIDFAVRLYIHNNLDKNNYNTLIRKVFEKILGKKIVKIEDITLTIDPWYGNGKGNKITFTDGTVYIHKLVERHTSDGNYGCDTYRLVLEGEEVKVEEINEN